MNHLNLSFTLFPGDWPNIFRISNTIYTVPAHSSLMKTVLKHIQA